MRLPAIAWATPNSRHCCVTVMSFCLSFETSPTPTVIAESEKYPFRSTPRSRLTTSPLASLREPGIPWITSSFSEMQMEAG